MKKIKYIVFAIIAVIAAVFIYLYTNKPAKEILARIDVSTSLVDAKKPQFDVYIDDSETPEKQAEWMVKYNNQGNIVQKTGNDVNITIKALKDADIKVNFKGPWEQDETGNLKELWVKYTSATVNGQEILPEPVDVWHNKSFTYIIDAKAGNTYKIHAEWTESSK